MIFFKHLTEYLGFSDQIIRKKYSPKNKEIVYFSENKLATADIPLTNKGRTFQAAGYGYGTTDSEVTRNQKIEHFLDFVARNNLVQVGNPSEGKRYILTTFEGKCGTAWPTWPDLDEEEQEEIRNDALNVAWWAGEAGTPNDKFQILLYGSRDNILGQGNVPPNKLDHRATWWPSIAMGYDKLIKDVSIAVKNNESLTDFSNNPQNFYSSFFKETLERGNALVDKGKFQAMIRVDKVTTQDTKTKKVTVFGSPVWVARV